MSGHILLAGAATGNRADRILDGAEIGGYE
jgi:hypothetical protein